MKNIVRLLLLGLMTWLVPFVASFFFIDKSGGFSVDIFFFKTIMILVGGITGAIAIIIYFIKVEKNFLNQGILIGFVWFILNVVLDMLVLLPMSKMPIPEYFMQIGLRYLMIPLMTLLVGYVLENKIVRSRNFII